MSVVLRVRNRTGTERTTLSFGHFTLDTEHATPRVIV